MENEIKISQIITKENLLAHWQGHRRLTSKVIMAFDDDKLFNYSIGGMRPFSEMAIELITIAAPGVIGMATGNWKEMKDLDPAYETPKSQEEILQLWDKTTNIIDQYWPKISSDRFQEEETAFGQYKGEIWSHLFYFIDNEIHHRAQGYVYLRSMGIEPPYFWER